MTRRRGIVRRLGAFLVNIRADVREVGGFGRVAWLGVAASLVVAIALGFSITSAAERHLLDGRVEMLSAIVDDLEAAERLTSPAMGGDRASFDAAVRSRLLGGETIQVKLWSPDGTIVYSDDAELEGGTFAVSALALRAFDGEPASARIAADDPAHAEHRELGRLIEVYLPFEHADDGAVVTVFEIEQQVDRLDAALSDIGRNVWLSIIGGIGALAVFLATLLIGRARVAERRRRQIEELLGALVEAQEEERRRIVGALHDDIGQPLYALMYGLEAAKRDAGENEASQRLERLEGVVRDIDSTLRAELRTIHEASIADAGLVAALEDLAAVTERESDLEVDLEVTLDAEPAPVARAVLYRAIREGVTNVRKHAGAHRLTIRVESDRSSVRAAVSDDGAGGQIEPGLGLTTTRERIEAIGGTLTVNSDARVGTVISVEVPVGERAS